MDWSAAALTAQANVSALAINPIIYAEVAARRADRRSRSGPPAALLRATSAPLGGRLPRRAVLRDVPAARRGPAIAAARFLHRRARCGRRLDPADARRAALPHLPAQAADHRALDLQDEVKAARPSAAPLDCRNQIARRSKPARWDAGECYTGQVADGQCFTSMRRLSMWGRHGFDGGSDPREACRAPSTRKSDGTKRNCGQFAARSRRLNPGERPCRRRLRGGDGVSFKQAGRVKAPEWHTMRSSSG